MRTKISSLLFPIFAALSSGVLLVLAFPKYNLGWLAWVGLLPLLIAISGKRPRYAFILSYICGIIFFTGNLLWLFEVPRYTFLHHCLIVSYWGIFIAFFGLAFNIISRYLGATPALFAAPFIWVCLEYVKSNLGFLALPWPWLAHSQFQVPSLIQIASVTGAYGVSFLIVMVNSALAAVVLPLLYKSRKNESLSSKPISKAGAIAVIGMAGLLLTFTLLYGQLALSKPIVGEGIRVSLVQGNIEQSKKWHPKHAKSIMQTYSNLSTEASESRPDLIVWPEAATPRAIDLDRRLYSQVRNMAETAGTYILLGSSSHQKFKVGRGQMLKFRNSAFLISPEMGLKNQRYDKIRLLPFGEYLPIEEIIRWSWLKVPNLASYIPGKDYTVFECNGFRFGVNICWEVGFPDLVRQFVLRGAECMFNLTNMAWFGKTAAPYQMLSVSVFRAVENRIYVVRCANTGVSCFIDPYGRIVNRVKDGSGQDIFVRGVLTETVIPMNSKTIYTRYGDWLVWLSMFFSVGFLILAFLKKRPEA